MTRKSQDPAAQAEDASRFNSGRPETGSGEGRKDVTGTTNVYPASGPQPPENAQPQQMASWGQGERGAEGYQDSGASEIIPSQQIGEELKDRESSR